MFAEPAIPGRLVASVRRLGTVARVALAILAVLYLLALLAPLLAPYAQSQQIDIVAMKNHPPSLRHWFGTDGFSRDVLTRVLYGARVSLSVATLAVLERLVTDKRLDPDQTICAVVSETGLKTEAEVPSRTGTAFDAESLRRLVHARLGAA